MASSSLAIRAAGSSSTQMKHSSNHDKSTPTSPSPSLWPETVLPIPASARRVQFNTASEMPDTEGCVLEGASCNIQGSAHTECAISSGHSNTTRIGSGSTFPSPVSTSTLPSPRPIDITAPNVFEPHYPTWHSYPPIHPTKFDTKRPVSPIRGGPFNATGVFLQQSMAFQNWVDKKNAERIQLRHGPNYEKLVDELHQYQYLADYGPTPPIRTDAKMHVAEIEKEMVEERKEFSAAELQYIRDIEKAWVSFVSIDSYEQAISRQRHLSAAPQVEPERSLSRVERLLGSDGSSLGTSSWTQRCQHTQHKMSYEEAGVEFMDLNGRGAKVLPSNPPENLPATVNGVIPWPDKPYETLIPDWFPVAEAQGNIEMNGSTVKERFNNLLNYIYQLEFAKSQHKYKEKHPDEEGILRDYKWDKQWHYPNPGWRHAHQRKRGGWWKCRKGPTASAAENKCELCLDVEISEPTPPAQILADIMGYIGEAMAVVAENDKKMVAKRKSNENHEFSGLQVFQRLVNESAKIWADNPLTTTEPETIPLGARQPWINYNPLRGLDDSQEGVATAQAYMQQMVAKNKEQERSNGKNAGKGK
ncbi:hypothetical protein E0Z10_g7763 [Xylaria hypoxylon]|uniref:Uncharacterized protein n=1 Tax=Xylaria hypoxylon TaxID=37992 RepID=A0A4Z0YPU4_9PEZI|nr:hypothetical protein E0Z10_g7763 [Xylaria hypoxylon]